MISPVCPKCFSDFIMWRVAGNPVSRCMKCGHKWDGLPQLKLSIKEQEEKRNERIQKSTDERP